MEDKLTEFLNKNNINIRESNNVILFYSKFEELRSLYKDSCQDFNGDKLLMAQGKYNSKSIFIFKDENHYKECIPYLNRVLNIYNVNLWDVIILFYDKFNDDQKNIDILVKELMILSPMVIYIYDDNNLKSKIDDIAVLSSKFINVNNITSILENNISIQIFDLFKYLITYDY